MDIRARDLIGTGFPPEEGGLLARKLLEKGSEVDWKDLSIDVRDLPSSLLISAFFNGFLQEIVDKNASLLGLARKTKWVLEFDFQRENVERWMSDFKSFDTKG